MKRKLLIFPGYFLPHIGGLETHVDEFAKYLSKDKNYSITIFAPNIPCASEAQWIHGFQDSQGEWRNRVRVIRYPAFELISNFPVPKFWSPRFWGLYRQLYREHWSLVMTRTRFFMNSFMGVFFAKFRFKRLKLMHVEHGSDFVRLSSSFKSFLAFLYDMTLGKLVVRLADQNVAISQSSFDFLQLNFLKGARVPIIQRGVDFDFYEGIGPKDLEFGDKVVLMYLGRLYKWKGVENAIKAYLSLSPELREKSVFVIVGYGEDLERLKKLATGEPLIHFTGSVSFKEAVAYLKSADIYVHSSYPGGALSNSLLQAMECRCAIVASPHEGAREVISDSEDGILLPGNSPKQISKGMKKLIDDKKIREKYSIAAQKKVRSEFDWNRVVEKYKREFDRLLK